MTIEKAIRLLCREYEIAKNLEWVHKPVAYALHKVWRVAFHHPLDAFARTAEGRMNMTCKDCLHYEVCKHHDAVVDFPVDDGVCRFFEDRTKWVEQRHGCRFCSKEDKGGLAWECSDIGVSIEFRAGKIRVTNEEGDEAYLNVRYCPNCGALMTEGSEGE